MGCVFCNRIENGDYDQADEFAVSFEPLDPVTPGHLLVVPRNHVENALTHPYTTARTMLLVARLAKAPCNIITSCGEAATQSIMHLHVHIVPRTEGDGLTLPWTGQKRTVSNPRLKVELGYLANEHWG